MIRFAFNPNESSLKKMEQLKNSGVTYALSELFRPKSIIKDSENNSHKKFENEKEVLDLFKIIDGSKDDSNILGFLNYEKIKEGNMCRHIVIVLPLSLIHILLDEIIQGRVEPYIYAFSTNTFPNYLKVGDTYRSVTERLNEWKKYYPNLKKEFEGTAKINEDLFFRDHSIHKFLIVEKHKTRLLASNVPKGVYLSLIHIYHWGMGCWT